MTMVTLRWFHLLALGLLVLLAGGLDWIGGEKVSVSRLPLLCFFPGMALDRWGPLKTGLQSAIWAAKLALLLIGIFSIAAFTKVAVPYATAILASTLPHAWAALCTWLVAPYLFITIHLIIIVIWKLSDQKHHHPWPADDKSLDSPEPVKPKDFGASPLLRKPSPEIWQEILHPSNLSCNSGRPEALLGPGLGLKFRPKVRAGPAQAYEPKF